MDVGQLRKMSQLTIIQRDPDNLNQFLQIVFSDFDLTSECHYETFDDVVKVLNLRDADFFLAGECTVVFGSDLSLCRQSHAIVLPTGIPIETGEPAGGGRHESPPRPTPKHVQWGHLARR